MGEVKATTNSQGNPLFAGIDLSSIKHEAYPGIRIDPWAQISVNVAPSTHKISEFFQETEPGDMVNERLATYNLLLRHIMRELAPDEDSEVVIRKSRLAKEIVVGKDTFLEFQKKIYRKKA
ncbi:MAG: hypothetical protein COA78_25135 [Blastopirellula sp.]|nr:MAG: hypothetical protein COA78_25135 [Blastopirellula sp.]